MNNKDIYELIFKKIPKENIHLNEPMKNHTTIKIGGMADFFITIKNLQELKEILKIANENNISFVIVGNGSNLLVKDKGIRGMVIKLSFNEVKINDQIVTVGSGVPLGKLAQVLLKESLSGFEFASGIPGTIGGAVHINAGAYGSEFKDIVIETTCMNTNGEIFKLNNKQQNFDYRSSIFKNENYIILECKLLLKKCENSEIIKNKMDEYKKSRLEKQPINYPSAGSTFKRGKDFITAQLIDQCGLKGYKVGGAQVSTKHAGFIVNTGNATAEDVLQLVEIVKKGVLDKFNKKIELEVEILGE